ncbi:MAG: hypothetical protein ACOYM1_10735 [Methylovulum sp.]
MSLCVFCFKVVPEHSAAGRPSEFCSDSCKMKVYRLRKKALNPDISQKSRKSNIVRGRFENEVGCVFRSPPVVYAPIHQPTKEIRTIQDLKDFFNGY